MNTTIKIVTLVLFVSRNTQFIYTYIHEYKSWSLTLVKPLDHFPWWAGTKGSKIIHLGKDTNCNLSTVLNPRNKQLGTFHNTL